MPELEGLDPENDFDPHEDRTLYITDATRRGHLIRVWAEATRQFADNVRKGAAYRNDKHRRSSVLFAEKVANLIEEHRGDLAQGSFANGFLDLAESYAKFEVTRCGGEW